jgi:hypothetical protein
MDCIQISVAAVTMSTNQNFHLCYKFDKNKHRNVGGVYKITD